MPKKSKADSSDTEASDNSSIVWSQVMDDVLIDAYHHEHVDGNRVGGTFTSTALNNILRKLQDKFPGKLFTKEKLHNHVKVIKRQFARCYDIFQNGGLSGFAWDPTTNKWCAESEAWDQLIQAKPAAKEWKDKPIRNFDKLLVIYGKDRATGKYAETGPEMLRRCARDNLKRPSTTSVTIDDIDELVSENVASLENTEEYGQAEHEQPTDAAAKLNVSSRTPLTNKTKRAKKDHVGEMATLLRGGLDHLASAINRLSTLPPIPESEIWAMVNEMGLEPTLITRAYSYICQHADFCRMLIGAPWEASAMRDEN
ncbi:uncharacterized protein LOC132632956 isoform X2 [Lycium barbarum]|uniref:uncharacterized protein LOC132632956 isoform X2 n=1 Tax=Lycium barbarum TaxID=112863 RepID=UPI00293E6CB1|nr:uncharacterized protein LOC132632956 isoform X2 [Lycium barbarum]XP_060205094.1 uncharacterized protein LOC132632956 isoform X2 [Lycium barbarum]XP_060205095.1 uncharacterized protein LOC132632956 isoform X2 [Lycium barbarum]